MNFLAEIKKRKPTNLFLFIFSSALVILAAVLFSKVVFLLIYRYRIPGITAKTTLVFLLFWVFYSFIFSKLKKIDFRDFLFKDALSFASFFLLFIPYLLIKIKPGLNLSIYFFILSSALFLASKSYFFWQKRKFKDISNKATWIILAGFILSYFIYFSILTVSRFQSLGAGCMDLGAMEQAILNTLHGKILYLTIYKTSYSRFASHLELPLLWLSPIYFIFRSAKSLLISQTLIISLGGLAAYLVAKEILKKNIYGLVFAATFLLYPPLEKANLFDFHSVVLASTFVLFAFYFLLKEKYLFYAIFIILAATCREEIFFLVAFLGIYIFFKKNKLVGTLTFLFSVAGFLLVIKYLLPYFQSLQLLENNLLTETGRSVESVRKSVSGVVRFDYLGKNFFEIIKNIFLHPGLVFKRMFLTSSSFSYFFLILTPFGFLSLFSPAALFIALPIYAINTLADFLPMRSGGFHYSASLAAPLLLAAIFGFKALRLFLKRQGLIKTGLVLITFLFFSSLFSYFYFGIHKKLAPLGPHQKGIYQVKKLIENNASLSVSTMLCSHFMRQELHQFPVIKDADYILLESEDYKWTNFKNYDLAVKKLRISDNDNYDVIYDENGYLLLKKVRGNLKGYKIFPKEAKEIKDL